MDLTRQDVEKVALLARLDLSEDEIEQMTSQLVRILAYIDRFAELDTDRVEPMAHAIEMSNVFRDDEVRPSLDRREALENAPHHDEQCYLVPAVLGD